MIDERTEELIDEHVTTEAIRPGGQPPVRRTRLVAALKPSLQRAVLWCLRDVEPPRPPAVVGAPAATPSGAAVEAEPTPRIASQISIRVLGPFELAVDGTAVVGWQGRLGPMVLKFLLAQPGRRASRDMLIEQFWPFADAERARNRLHVAISSLRRALRSAGEVDLVEHQDGWYRLNSDVSLTVDIDEFDRWRDEGERLVRRGDPERAIDAFRRAADLYRGDYLADLPFEDWTATTREAYRAAYVAVLERLSGLAEQLARPADACDAAARMLRVDPCREEAHRALMRCHAAQRRLSEVLRQFERCRKSLAESMGVSPSPETVALYRHLRAELAVGCDLTAAPTP